MITLEQYFGLKPHDAAHAANARELLERVNALLDEAANDPKCGYAQNYDPDTQSQISGSEGGSGDGGFRLHNAATGAPTSSHKEARGVDVYDPMGKLAVWLNDAILTRYRLYREHPAATPGWCHLTTRPPRSGRRTFTP